MANRTRMLPILLAILLAGGCAGSAKLTRQSELVPDPLDPAVHRAVATAVAGAAKAEGLDRPDRVPPGLSLR